MRESQHSALAWEQYNGRVWIQSPPLAPPKVSVIARYLWGTHSSQYELGFRGYKSISPAVAYGAVQAIRPLQRTTVTIQQIPDHPGPTISRAVGLSVTRPLQKSSDITIQETPYHPLPQVSKPLIPGNVAKLGEQRFIGQEWPFVGYGFVLTQGSVGFGAAQASRPLQSSSISTKQETPYHPLPWAKKDLIVGNVALLGKQLVTVQEWPFIGYGYAIAQGPVGFGSAQASRPLQASSILTRQETPYHPDSQIVPATGLSAVRPLQSNNINIVTKQELPDHPVPWVSGSYLVNFGYLGQQIATSQETPYHPRSSFTVPGLPNFGYLGKQLVVIQEWPFTGSAPSWTTGPVAYGAAQAINPLQGTWAATVLEIPDHPLPWTIGHPPLLTRLPGFGQVIIIPQEWPFVGAGGPQFSTGPIAFGSVESVTPLQGVLTHTTRQEFPEYYTPQLSSPPLLAFVIPTPPVPEIPSSGGVSGPRLPYIVPADALVDGVTLRSFVSIIDGKARTISLYPGIVRIGAQPVLLDMQDIRTEFLRKGDVITNDILTDNIEDFLLIIAKTLLDDDE